MTTAAAHVTDFAFDYTRGANAKAPVAGKKSGVLKRWFAGYVAQRQAAAMAQIEMVDPRLAREIRTAQDRAEWNNAS